MVKFKDISSPDDIKLFPYSTQLSTEFIMIMNVKMPTSVGILTFINMLNTVSKILKAKYVFIFSILVFFMNT